MNKIINEKINKLRLLDLENVEYDFIVEKVSELVILASQAKALHEATTVACTLKKGERLFRAHFKHNKDDKLTREKTPTYVSSILAPQKKLVKGFQRCNPPQSPMFYASTCIERSLRECRANTGDFLFLSEWEVIEDLNITSVTTNIPDKLLHSHSILFNFFADKFIQRIHHTFSYEYKLTAAITQVLLGVKKKNSSLAGISYPSVVSKKRGENFALLPEFQSKLKLVKTQKVEIAKTTPLEYVWVEIESTTNFYNNRINWRTFEQSIIFPKNIPILEKGQDKVGHYIKLVDGQILRGSIQGIRKL